MIENVELVKMTPASAKKLLESNESNRPLNRRALEKCFSAMDEGEWKFNGDTIKIGKSGRLLDGQHRLNAIVLSGKPATLLVVKNLDDDVFDTIDTGKNRSAGDVLSISGYKNATVVASIGRWYGYLNGLFKPSDTVTHHKIREIVEAHPGMAHWATRYAGSKTVRSLLPAGALAVFYISSQKNGQELLDSFFDHFDTGTGINKTNPVYELRERMISVRGKISKLPIQNIVAMVIKSVNAYVMGEKIVLLRHGADEKMPEIK